MIRLHGIILCCVSPTLTAASSWGCQLQDVNIQKMLYHFVDHSAHLGTSEVVGFSREFTDFCKHDNECVHAVRAVHANAARSVARRWYLEPQRHDEEDCDPVKLLESIAQGSADAAAEALRGTIQVLDAMIARMPLTNGTSIGVTSRAAPTMITKDHLTATLGKLVHDSRTIKVNIDALRKRLTKPKQGTDVHTGHGNQTLDFGIPWLESFYVYGKCHGDEHLCNMWSPQQRFVRRFLTAITDKQVLPENPWVRLAMSKLAKREASPKADIWSGAPPRPRTNKPAADAYLQDGRIQRAVSAQGAKVLDTSRVYRTEAFNMASGRLHTMSVILLPQKAMSPELREMGLTWVQAVNSTLYPIRDVTFMRLSDDLLHITQGIWQIEQPAPTPLQDAKIARLRSHDVSSEKESLPSGRNISADSGLSDLLKRALLGLDDPVFPEQSMPKEDWLYDPNDFPKLSAEGLAEASTPGATPRSYTYWRARVPITELEYKLLYRHTQDFLASPNSEVINVKAIPEAFQKSMVERLKPAVDGSLFSSSDSLGNPIYRNTPLNFGPKAATMQAVEALGPAKVADQQGIMRYAWFDEEGKALAVTGEGSRAPSLADPLLTPPEPFGGEVLPEWGEFAGPQAETAVSEAGSVMSEVGSVGRFLSTGRAVITGLVKVAKPLLGVLGAATIPLELVTIFKPEGDHGCAPPPDNRWTSIWDNAGPEATMAEIRAPCYITAKAFTEPYITQNTKMKTASTRTVTTTVSATGEETPMSSSTAKSSSSTASAIVSASTLPGCVKILSDKDIPPGDLAWQYSLEDKCFSLIPKECSDVWNPGPGFSLDTPDNRPPYCYDSSIMIGHEKAKQFGCLVSPWTPACKDRILLHTRVIPVGKLNNTASKTWSGQVPLPSLVASTSLRVPRHNCASLTLPGGFTTTKTVGAKCPKPTPAECTYEWWLHHKDELPDVKDKIVERPVYCAKEDVQGHFEAERMGCLPDFKAKKCFEKFLVPEKKIGGK